MKYGGDLIIAFIVERSLLALTYLLTYLLAYLLTYILTYLFLSYIEAYQKELKLRRTHQFLLYVGDDNILGKNTKYQGNYRSFIS